ncbi:hypothetical protein Poli38472_010812 [Pythium oligandrum]|uniref:Uncharacterized protein n=1 Tax=Pythium oligandrum TaxID=41045 RepID=A0A8K1CE39_PYTOL|nr:hypothetical protein Poli38472_010812 [Pythium oligandrum]|eukprot:TMW61749.1 hypothetical protein Poli38472_010812 [Pythium oligandrum]
MEVAAADAQDLALFLSDEDEEETCDEPTETATEEDLGSEEPPSQDDNNDELSGMESVEQLQQQIVEQVQPWGHEFDSVEAILEQIRPNASDEASVALVTAHLQRLPSDVNIKTLIQLLGGLREEYVPKDAIMSIWFKILHPKKAKRAKSAGTMPILRSRLLESKRKQAECDLQLLQNRISLLQQEESRAWKKILQTKDRAQEILEIREANLKKQEAKSHLALERERQSRFVQKKQHSLKKESIIKKKHAAIQIISRKYQDVEIVKSESKRLKAEKEKQQMVEVERAREKREAIRRQEDALKQKRREEQRQHEQEIALRYMKKVIEEERKIKEHQRRVQAMEQQEKELIERLQGTQLIQQEAFSVLEQALLRAELRASAAQQHEQNVLLSSTSSTSVSASSLYGVDPLDRHASLSALTIGKGGR